MNGSNHLAESDARPLHLCPVDLRKLQWSIGFDVVERYRRLLDFCRQEGLTTRRSGWTSGSVHRATRPERGEALNGTSALHSPSGGWKLCKTVEHRSWTFCGSRRVSGRLFDTWRFLATNRRRILWVNATPLIAGWFRVTDFSPARPDVSCEARPCLVHVAKSDTKIATRLFI